MKALLKELQVKNKNHFELVLYLWLNSDSKGIFSFKIDEICSLFSISKTSLERFLDSIKQVEYIRLGKGFRIINFSESIEKKQVEKAVKKVEKTSQIEYNGRLRKFLKDFYFKHNYDYPELERHFRFALGIMSKMDKLIKEKNEVVTEEIRFDSFCIFFEKLPIWWTENRKLSLVTLNKNFTNILNQIKTGQNDKYNSLKQGAESIDFSGFTN